MKNLHPRFLKYINVEGLTVSVTPSDLSLDHVFILLKLSQSDKCLREDLIAENISIIDVPILINQLRMFGFYITKQTDQTQGISYALNQEGKNRFSLIRGLNPDTGEDLEDFNTCKKLHENISD